MPPAVLMPSSSTCSLRDRSGPGSTSAPACEGAAQGLGAGLGAGAEGTSDGSGGRGPPAHGRWESPDGQVGRSSPNGALMM